MREMYLSHAPDKKKVVVEAVAELEFRSAGHDESFLLVERDGASRVLPGLDPDDIAMSRRRFRDTRGHECLRDAGSMPFLVDVKSEYLDRSSIVARRFFAGRSAVAQYGVGNQRSGRWIIRNEEDLA